VAIGSLVAAAVLVHDFATALIQPMLFKREWQQRNAING